MRYFFRVSRGACLSGKTSPTLVESRRNPLMLAAPAGPAPSQMERDRRVSAVLLIRRSPDAGPAHDRFVKRVLDLDSAWSHGPDAGSWSPSTEGETGTIPRMHGS